MSRKESDVYMFQFDVISKDALVDLLVFAAQTAAYLADKELEAGHVGEDLKKLIRLTKDAKDLLTYIKTSVDIGEPSSEDLH